MENVIKKYISDLKQGLDHLDISKIKLLVDLFEESYSSDRNIFIFGNGGSAATASHLACDINKGVSYGRDKRFRLICLNDNIPTMMAYANDVSYSDIFLEQLKNFLKEGDLVIGFSGSGNSENVIKAIDYANKNKATTFGITGFDGGKLSKIANQSLTVEINDMQKVEDAHLIITHILMQALCGK